MVSYEISRWLRKYLILLNMADSSSETDFKSSLTVYTLAQGIMISVRSLQRSEEDVSDPLKYM